jgi:uracil phosphoribosyltransferase
VVTARLTVVDHPLVAHKVTLLRDVGTGPEQFRSLCHEVTLLTAYEALRDLPLTTRRVTTPLVATEAPVLDGPAPAVVGILRAGLIMVEAILTLLPHAPVGHIGLYRDPATNTPVEYYCKLPADIAQRAVVLVDPMLATGGSAAHAITLLRKAGCTEVRLLSIVGCPQGVAAVAGPHPEVSITLGALDPGMDDHAYIVPGLGDAGDRIYGTR